MVVGVGEERRSPILPLEARIKRIIPPARMGPTLSEDQASKSVIVSEIKNGKRDWAVFPRASAAGSDGTVLLVERVETQRPSRSGSTRAF